MTDNIQIQWSQVARGLTMLVTLKHTIISQLFKTTKTAEHSTTKTLTSIISNRLHSPSPSDALFAVKIRSL